jgi:hypothetical protein
MKFAATRKVTYILQNHEGYKARLQNRKNPGICNLIVAVTGIFVKIYSAYSAVTTAQYLLYAGNHRAGG